MNSSSLETSIEIVNDSGYNSVCSITISPNSNYQKEHIFESSYIYILFFEVAGKNFYLILFYIDFLFRFLHFSNKKSEN